MGIPKRGSKRIEIDGKPYRYLVKETHVPDHKDQKELSVVVQEDVDKPGAPLRFRASYGMPVTATVIVETVRQAQTKGWKPEARGSAFDFEAGL